MNDALVHASLPRTTVLFNAFCDINIVYLQINLFSVHCYTISNDSSCIFLSPILVVHCFSSCM